MHSKYTALESKSKDMIVQQNNAVSGATIALSDLGSRLNSLVEQLVASYSISEQEIEVSGWRASDHRKPRHKAHTYSRLSCC